KSADGVDARWEGVRRFFEDLSGKAWCEADEECLAGLVDISESQVKASMREAYRRSQIHPLPSFRYLINLGKRPDSPTVALPSSRNPDAVSAAERERLANLLAEQLAELAVEIVDQLGLSDSKAEILREQLEVAEGRIIGRLTPLI
ncbi:MAG TPA: hypothetical protein VFV34_02000, partial [Blastocatellia bacterium]|nr:hypothetical protein [Blastocatellia bacterium]